LVYLLEMQFAEAPPVAGPLERMQSSRIPIPGSVKTSMRVSLNPMRFAVVSLIFFLLAACASEPLPVNPDAQTKKDVKARDEFARDLPKPPER
jgi:hypothetical protein